MSTRIAYEVPMSALGRYVDGLSFYDPYLCPNDVLQTTLTGSFDHEVQQMKKHGKEIVKLALNEGTRFYKQDLEDIRKSLYRIARKINERRSILNSAIASFSATQKHWAVLSKPCIDKTKDSLAWLEQTLERGLAKVHCLNFFYGSSILEAETEDWPSKVKLLQGQLDKIDLVRCKKIASEYTSTSKEMESLADQLYKQIEMRYPG